MRERLIFKQHPPKQPHTFSVKIPVGFPGRPPACAERSRGEMRRLEVGPLSGVGIIAKAIHLVQVQGFHVHQKLPLPPGVAIPGEAGFQAGQPALVIVLVPSGPFHIYVVEQVAHRQ